MTALPATKWISTADTAKLIRADLKRVFPAVKFTVKSKSYSGGSSITIGWTDGPTSPEIDGLVSGYRSGHFDAMTDSYHYRPAQIVNGEPIQYSARHIFTYRAYTTPYYQAVADRVTQRYGLDRFVVKESEYGGPDYSAAWGIMMSANGNLRLQEVIYRALEGKD